MGKTNLSMESLPSKKRGRSPDLSTCGVHENIKPRTFILRTFLMIHENFYMRNFPAIWYDNLPDDRLTQGGNQKINS